MFQLIKNLYSKSTSTVKIDNYKTSGFSYLRGFRQGSVLSPLLFNLFQNELPWPRGLLITKKQIL